MLSCPYFKELYLTRSSARPRLLFAVDKVGEELHFYSSPQPQIPYDKSSLVEAVDYHTKFPSRRCNYASGLICFSGKCHSRKDALTLICNPITGKYEELPKVIMYNTSKAFLGYEEFKVIEAECFTHKTPTFINYKGKLGGINWESGDTGAKLRMWVLHDVEKQEWSSYVYPLPENDVIKLHEFTVAGMTTRGEFVMFLLDTFKRFYVFYFNPEKNTLRSVEIQGFGENVSSFKVFVGHVEDFNFF
uniref:F-box associated beta-propeller type 3 domain-containing protein n=1 Tax=Brassica campestris TaxID=3711 RepID=M4CLJ6_BRACM